MKNRILLFTVSISLFLQSCYTYKGINNDEMKVKRQYNMRLINNQDIEATYLGIENDTILVKVNGNFLRLSKDKIVDVKRKKTSVLMVIGASTLVVTSAVLLASDFDNRNSSRGIGDSN